MHVAKGKLMRRTIAACLITACIASVALAQEASQLPEPSEAAEPPQPAPAQLRWARQPDARAFSRNYPSRAANQGISGAAVVCCSILADGHLDCTVPFAWPRDYGFDEATLRISGEFRLTEESAAQLAGGRIRRQIVWIVGTRTPELDAVLTRIREGTQNACGPAIDWSERAPEDVVVTGTPEVRRE